MSPATLSAPDVTEIPPAETRSPMTVSLPPPLMVTALPAAPPQPAWSSAVMAAAYRRLPTEPVALPAMVGRAPLVRMAANWSWSGRVALSANSAPCGPSEETTWVRIVPSENVHVTVKELAPGDPYAGEQTGPAYRRRLVPKMLVAACSALE